MITPESTSPTNERRDMELKRWNFEYYDDAPHDSGMEEDPKGEYVLFSDVEKLIEDAEKYRDLQKPFSHREYIPKLEQKAVAHDSLLSHLVVDCKCPYMNENCKVGKDIYSCRANDCHGSGIITRPATVEEMREVFETLNSGDLIGRLFMNTDGDRYFLLKDGGKLRWQQ